jgi:hypothetical protein
MGHRRRRKSLLCTHLVLSRVPLLVSSQITSHISPGSFKKNRTIIIGISLPIAGIIQLGRVPRFHPTDIRIWLEINSIFNRRNCHSYFVTPIGSKLFNLIDTGNYVIVIIHAKKLNTFSIYRTLLRNCENTVPRSGIQASNPKNDTICFFLLQDN